MSPAPQGEQHCQVQLLEVYSEQFKEAYSGQHCQVQEVRQQA